MMLVEKSGLGLLNPVTSEHEKYLSSQQGRAELIQAVTGAGALSNADNLRTLWKERRNRKKDRETVYENNLKVLVRNLKGTNMHLVLLTRSTGAWMSVHGTEVSGPVLSATEF